MARACFAAFLVLGALVAAADARADPPRQVFRPPTLLDPERCVSVDERRRVERSKSPEAFDDEIGVYLGPFFWASRDRTFMQVMLFYWRNIDVEGNARFELLFPLWAHACDPEAHVSVGPLGLAASKTDAAGSAGYVGPYFSRRDEREETDVLFPFYWSFREPGASFLIAGPWYDVEGGGRRTWGLVPLYFGARAHDSYYEISPLFARWGTDEIENLWFAQTWLRTSREGWDAASVPFYFGGASARDGGYRHTVPLLLTSLWADRDPAGRARTGMVVGPFFDLREGDDQSAGVVPFAFWGRHAAPASRKTTSWFVAPLLLGGKVDVGDRETWFVGPGYLSQSDVGSDFGLAPLYFGARSKVEGGFEMDAAPLVLFARWAGDGGRGLIAGPWYDVVNDAAGTRRFGLVPLAFGGADRGDRGGVDGGSDFLVGPGYGFWRDALEDGGVERRGWIAQTWWTDTPRRRSSTSLPFWFHAEDDVANTAHTIIPPLAFGAWRGARGAGLVAGPYFDVQHDDDHTAGIAPFAFWGQRDGADWFAAPLLLAGRYADAERDTTFVGPGYLSTSTQGADFGIAPLYLGARSKVDGGIEMDVVPPLLFARWDRGRDRGFAALPFVVHGEDDAARSSFTLIPPLLAFSSTTPTSELFAVGPWWEQRDANGWLLWVMPAYFAGARRDAWYRVAPPLLSASWGDARGARGQARTTTIVPPLLLLRATDGPDELLVVGPWWEAKRDDAWELWVPPLYFAGGARRGTQTPIARLLMQDAPLVDTTGIRDFRYRVIPALLLASWETRDDGGLVAGPYYDLRRPGERHRGLVPLAFTGASREGDYVVGPGYGFWSHAPTNGVVERHGWIAQTWWSDAPQRRAFTSLPFVFHAEDDVADTAHTIIPPLAFGAWRGRRGAGLVAGPYFDVQHDEDRTAGVAPFAFWGRRDDADWFAAPLLLAGRYRDGARDTTFVGPGYLSTSTQGADFGIAPLYFGARSKVDGGFEMDAAPLALFARWAGDGGRGLIAGPWYDVTNDAAGARRFGLVPLAFGGTDRGDLDRGGVSRASDFLVGPGYGFWGTDLERHGWIAQTWWSDAPQRRSSTSLPFWFHAEDDLADTAHTIIPPLAFGAWRGARGAGLVAGPYFDVQHDDDQTAGVAPLAFWGRQDGASWFAAPLVLAGRYADAERDTTFVGPGYLSTSTQGADFGIAPLYFGARSKVDGGFEMDAAPLALFARWAGDGGRGLITGPWYDVTNDAAGARRFGLVPLAFGGVDGRSDFLVGPGYGFWGSDDERHGWIAQTWWTDAPQRRALTSLPFVFHAEDDAAGSAHTIVPPLLFATWADGRGRNDVVVGQTWWTERPEGWSLWSAPFYFGADGDRRARPWYHVVPPLLSGAWGDASKGERGLAVAPPVFFHREDRTSSTTLALLWFEQRDATTGDHAQALVPFWFAGRRGADTWRVAAPVYWSFEGAEGRRSFLLPTLTYWSTVDDESILLAPLVYLRSDAVTSDTVVFPFWWDFRGEDLRATVASGVWWDFEWHASQRRLRLAPGYLHWEDQEEDFRIAGPISWSKSKVDLAWSFHVFPVASVWSFHPEHVRWRALLGVLGYEREREVEQWMVLGMKTPKTTTKAAPQRAPARGGES